MNALHLLTYGTFVLTVKKKDKKNGCIINTLIQINEDTLLMSLQNFSYTNSLLELGDYITLHTIHNEAPRSLFETFGLQSGRSTDKFKDIDYTEDKYYVVLENGFNSYFKGQITEFFPQETHTLYLIHLISSQVCNDIPSLTYKEYHEITKPRMKTQRNLLEAFKNESMARNKYTYYASVAKKEGYPTISNLFLTIAANEKEHGEVWAKQLGLIHETTQENLKNAIEAENKEWQKDYKRCELEALEEGNKEAAYLFQLIQTIERNHAQEFLKVLYKLKEDNLFKDQNVTTWICSNCGYTYTAQEALQECPMCNHPQGYMERKESL